MKLTDVARNTGCSGSMPPENVHCHWGDYLPREAGKTS
jgi:hypothetical protein